MKFSNSDAFAIQKASAPAIFFCFCKQKEARNTTGKSSAGKARQLQKAPQDRPVPFPIPPNVSQIPDICKTFVCNIAIAATAKFNLNMFSERTKFR